MKKYVTLGLIIAAVGYFGAVKIRAGEHAMPPKPSSKEFEQLKELIGHWEGTSSEKADEKITVDYKLTAGGSAIIETLFAGTPHEMVSIYYDQNGKLTMTHYCMLGNQPQMVLKKATATEMEFELAKGNAINPSKDLHMHSLTISHMDANTLVENWTCYEAGKQKEATMMRLARSE